jgi:hypothetical protein
LGFGAVGLSNSEGLAGPPTALKFRVCLLLRAGSLRVGACEEGFYFESLIWLTLVFLCAAVTSPQVSFSTAGGVEIEENWDKVKTITIPTATSITGGWGSAKPYRAMVGLR